MEFFLNILTPEAEIKRLILEEIKQQLKFKWSSLRLKLENAFKDYIELVIRESDFYNNLLTGKLKTELGIVDPSLTMSQIIDALKSTTIINIGDIKIDGDKLQSIITFNAVPDDFGVVLSVPLAKYTSINVKGVETIVPWLFWVLFGGAEPIVYNYKIVFNQPYFSRTNDAIMRKKDGGTWSVPSQFAGTQHDNFIFNALNNNIPQLENILDTLLTREF